MRTPHTQSAPVTRHSARGILAAGLLPLAAGAADDWHVENATLRFRVETVAAPTHASAGYIVTIPDGGILPRQGPGTVVCTADGQPLGHGLLWHDPARGLALVFDGPQPPGTAFVYVRGGPRTDWKPDSGLTPSVLAFLRQGGQNLNEAQRLSRLPAAGQDVYMERTPVMGMGALPQGIADRFADYVTGYVDAGAGGRTWVALMSGGPTSARINGRELNPRRESAKPAGTGEWLDLPAGLSRVELLHAAPGAQERGYVWLWWRRPDTPAADLKPKETGGEPQWAAYPVKPEECVQSGRAAVRAVEARDGAPVAVFSARATGYVLFTNAPVVLYRFAALTNGLPPGAACTWQVGEAGRLTGSRAIYWLVESGRPFTVTLGVAAQNRKSSATYDLFSYCAGNAGSDIGQADVRAIYRGALMNMLAAAAPGRNPAAGWGEDMWLLIRRLIEPGEGADLLRALCEGAWPAMRGQVPAAHRWRIEDRYFDTAVVSAPEGLLKWLDGAEAAERDGGRQTQWRIRRIELLMYELDRADDARKLAAALVSNPGEGAVRAQTRLGDLALLKGDLNEAVRRYGEAQQRAAPFAAAAHRAAKPPPATAAWKAAAVRLTSESETVRALIRDGYLPEARAKLDEWELEQPMSKVSGDYVLVEARYLLAAGNARRAAAELEAYGRAVDSGAFLPEAMGLALDAMAQARVPKDRLKSFCDLIRKVLPLDPVAQRAAEVVGGGGGGERD